MRVGLGQRGRHALAAGGDQHRPRHVAAGSENDVRLAPLQDSPAGERRPPREESGAKLRQPRPPGQPRHTERVELVARVRNEPRFDAIRRPGERHGCSAGAQGLRHGERGQDVTRGPPGRDQAAKLAVGSHRRSRC